MPIYEYTCDDCKHNFEEFLSIPNRDKPTKESCPECGKKDSVRKGVSATTMGVDANVKLPSWFTDKIQGMKKTTPKRYHANLDRAGNRSGGRLGPQ